MIRFIFKKIICYFPCFPSGTHANNLKHIYVPAYLRSLNKLKRQINIGTCCYCDVISCNYTTLIIILCKRYWVYSLGDYTSLSIEWIAQSMFTFLHVTRTVPGYGHIITQ